MLPLLEATKIGRRQAQAEQLGWNATRLRKARQFAHPEEGYSRDRLKELCRLLREHRPEFGVSHVGLLVTVPWPDREQIQKECIEGNWSLAELQAEIKKRYGSRRKGGRRRRVPDEPGHVLLQIDEMADSWLRWDALPDQTRQRVKAVTGAMKRLREDVLAELAAARKKTGPEAAPGDEKAGL